MTAFPASRSTARRQLRSISPESVSSHEKSRPKAALSSQTKSASSVIDDDLAAVVVHIPIMIALLDDDRVMIAVIAVTNHIAVANYIDVAVAMALADGHADWTHTHADFLRKRRQRSPDHRGGRDRSYI
jgi:hypothetical protein